MTIKAQPVESNHNNFSNIAKGAAIGGVAGYALKYWYPLTGDEKDEEFKAVMNIIKKESKKSKHKAIEDIRKIPQKTLAQDTFIKIVDANRALEKTNPKADLAANTFRMLKQANLQDTDRIQYKNIVSAVQKRAHIFGDKCAKAFIKVTKDKRSTPWFIAAGVVAGFIGGVGHNIIKSDV